MTYHKKRDFNSLRLQNYIDVLPKTNKFKKLREDSYLTNCPCHDDNNPSLAISQGHSRVIFKCFAGCSQQELLNYFSNALRQS